MSVVRVAVSMATVSPITIISLFVGPQASIDPSLPALGPPGQSIAATQGRHNKDLGLNIHAFALILKDHNKQIK